MPISVGWNAIIRLTEDEQAKYDERVASVLRTAITEFSRFNGHVDTDEWSPVRRRDQMVVYRSLQSSNDPTSTLMVGTGLIPGSLEDVMDGNYCETTAELVAVKTFHNVNLLDASLLCMNERRTADAPFRFAGIKWFAAKMPWTMDKRDLLTYERMGTTMDANGHPLAFHVVQSIDHPKWKVDSTKGFKRLGTSTCYLYRRHHSRVQCFIYANVENLGFVSRKVAEMVVAGSLLDSVLPSAECAEAKKLSALVATSAIQKWPSTAVCHVCFKGPGLLETSNRTCAGCSQSVCKSCSDFHAVFHVDTKTKRPLDGRFCKLCVGTVRNAVSSSKLLRQRLSSDPTRRSVEKHTSPTRNRSTSSPRQQKIRNPRTATPPQPPVRALHASNASWRSASVFKPNGAFMTSDAIDKSNFCDSLLSIDHLTQTTDDGDMSAGPTSSFCDDFYDSRATGSSFQSQSTFGSLESRPRERHPVRESDSSSLVDDAIWSAAALSDFDLGTMLRLSDSTVSSSRGGGRSRQQQRLYAESEF